MAHDSKKISTLQRLLPALIFMLGLLVLVVVAYDTGYSALPPAEKRYNNAKMKADALTVDVKRSRHRDLWLELAQEFLDIYTREPQWAQRSAALFRSAHMLEELGQRSFAAKDYRAAAERYEQLATQHPGDRLSDDALLRAADIRAHRLHDTPGALRNLAIIRTHYGKADMAPDAAQLEKKLVSTQNPSASSQKPQAQAPPVAPSAASPAPKKAQSPEIQRISWVTLSKDKVQITVELSTQVAWQVRMSSQGKESAAKLHLELTNAVPSSAIASGASIKGSLLSRVSVQENKAQGTTLVFDFNKARRYDTKVEHNPFRIILTVTTSAGPAPRGVGSRMGFAEAQQPSPAPARKAMTRPVPVALRTVPALAAQPAFSTEMATQLGLSVHTVFIDAGHGGKDPGTVHHGLIESHIALDIALRVGRLLKAQGLDVVYSRTGDSSVPLSVRPRTANDLTADIFLSVHINANTDATVQGFETFYLDIARSSHAARVAALENATSDQRLGDMHTVLANVMLNARTKESINLAQDIQRNTLAHLQKRDLFIRDGGTRSAPFHTLIGARMPAVLVEVGYSSHTKEAERLKNAEYRGALAQGIAAGIMAYKKRLQRRQSAQDDSNINHVFQAVSISG